jgi:ABC-type bacteriocin/lantibiotic exporter with double-glycine peptidase domain
MPDSLPTGLFALIWRHSGVRQLIIVALSAVIVPIGLVPLELQRRVIDDAIAQSSLDLLVILCAIYLGVVILQGGLKYAMNMLRGRVSEAMARDLRHAVLAANATRSTDPCDDDDAEEPTVGVDVTVLTAEVDPVGNFSGGAYSIPIVEAGTLLATFAYMAIVEPVLAAVAVGLFIPQAAIVPIIQSAINRRSQQRIETLRDLGENVVEQYSEPGTKPEEDRGSRLATLVNRLFFIRQMINRIKFRFKFLMNFIDHLAVIGVLFAGGWLVIDGNTEVGTVVAFLSGLQRLRAPWRDLVAYYRSASDARVKYGLIRDTVSRH